MERNSDSESSPIIWSDREATFPESSARADFISVIDDARLLPVTFSLKTPSEP